jgi:anti-anti-sigma factor
MIDDVPTGLADSPPVDAGAGGIWLNYRIVADALVVTVAGEMELSTQHLLVDAIGAAIVGARPACVRLDLDRVSFIDARGVAALVDCAELATASGAHFEIPYASQQVRAVLAACQLSDLLSVRDDARPAS